mmetsp:Transcript_15203/g.35810  ORF Transcript_15203/g.35810 Transcript_15203/m.35810 type:complete len:303 (-) Transcript_15203:174-1082(-)
MEALLQWLALQLVFVLGKLPAQRIIVILLLLGLAKQARVVLLQLLVSSALLWGQLVELRLGVECQLLDLSLDLADLGLVGRSLCEDRIYTLPFCVVAGAQGSLLHGNIGRVNTGAGLVHDKVVVCQRALQLPHILDQRLVSSLKLAIGGVVVIILFNFLLHLVDGLSHFFVFLANLPQIVRFIGNLSPWSLCANLHAHHTLLCHWSVRDLQVGVEPNTPPAAWARRSLRGGKALCSAHPHPGRRPSGCCAQWRGSKMSRSHPRHPHAGSHVSGCGSCEPVGGLHGPQASPRPQNTSVRVRCT